jgi:hypothetical protein
MASDQAPSGFSKTDERHWREKFGEFNTIMPWTDFAGMTEEDLGAIYEYLRTVAPVRNEVTIFSHSSR